MLTLVRFIVMWFIAVALPLQGVAVATTLHCGPEEHGEVVLHDHHRAHSEAGDEAHAASATVALFAHADAPAALTHDHHAHHASACGVCASCCSAAAFPAVSWLLPIAEATQMVASFAVLPAAAFLTGGPERPPRFLLA